MTELSTDLADAATEISPVSTRTTHVSTHSDQEADELRGAMVGQIIARYELLGRVLPGEVEAALRTVRRHLFAPGVPLKHAYADYSIVCKGTSAALVSARCLRRGCRP